MEPLTVFIIELYVVSIEHLHFFCLPENFLLSLWIHVIHLLFAFPSARFGTIN